MKNLIKIISLTIFTILLTFGSAFAQDDTKSSKSEKKCSGTCCSSKEADSTMNKKEMRDHHLIDKNKDGKIFECPMKCEAGKDIAGECSKCGMNLKEISINDMKEKKNHKEHKMMDHSKMDHSKMMKGEMDHKEMSDHHSIDKNKDGKIFECPMKCEAGKDAPGECSKCGMKLKEVSIKE